MQRRATLANTIYLCFVEKLKDPRRPNASHPLQTVIFCVLVGVMCGADGFVQAERIARLREKFIARYVPLPHGIPGHDTMARVFATLDSAAFVDAFVLFMSRLVGVGKDEIINIDGKTLRGAVNKLAKKQAEAEDQVHMVTAFNAMRGVVLGQLRSAAVANEIAAAQDLLRLVRVHGCTVTLDAAHTCIKTLDMIKERGADVVIGVKGNSKNLYRDIVAAFQSGGGTVIEQSEQHRGRVEHRKYTVIVAKGESLGDFTTLRTFVRTERQRIYPTGPISASKVAYYATSLSADKAERIADCVRHRWSIENKLHHVLDVTFGEDDSRVRTDNAAENLSRIRHLALSLLHEDKAEKIGLGVKRSIALADDAYLARILRL